MSGYHGFKRIDLAGSNKRYVFGCLFYDDIEVTINRQIAYHTRDAVPKVLRLITPQYRLF